MTTWRRFLRFSVVGALGIGTQLTTLWILLQTGVHYAPATALAVATAIGHNFLWHRRWTWADRVGADPSGVRSFVTFALANGAVSMVGNVVVMVTLVDLVSIAPMIANVAAIALCGLLNFWLGDRLVFRVSGLALRRSFAGRT